ncbi:MAG: hypothetical protein ACSNEK_03125 [Parachlamydiaceae bacterium]
MMIYKYGFDPVFTKLVDKIVKYQNSSVEKLDQMTWRVEYVRKHQLSEKTYHTANCRFSFVHLKLKKLSHQFKMVVGKFCLFRKYRDAFRRAWTLIEEINQRDLLNQQILHLRTEVYFLESTFSELQEELATYQGRLKDNEQALSEQEKKLESYNLNKRQILAQLDAFREIPALLESYYRSQATWLTKLTSQSSQESLKTKLRQVVPNLLFNAIEQDSELAELAKKQLTLSKKKVNRLLDDCAQRIHDLLVEKDSVNQSLLSIQERSDEIMTQKKGVELRLQELEQSHCKVAAGWRDDTPSDTHATDLADDHLVCSDMGKDRRTVNGYGLLDRDPFEVARHVLNRLSTSSRGSQKIASYLKKEPPDIQNRIDTIRGDWQNIIENSPSSNKKKLFSKVKHLSTLQQSITLPVPQLIEFVKSVDITMLAQCSSEVLTDILLLHQEPSSEIEQQVRDCFSPLIEMLLMKANQQIDSPITKPFVNQKKIASLNKLKRKAALFNKGVFKKTVARVALSYYVEDMIDRFSAKTASLAFKQECVWFAQSFFDRFFEFRSLESFLKVAIRGLNLLIFFGETVAKAHNLEKDLDCEVNSSFVSTKKKKLSEFRDYSKKKLYRLVEETLLTTIRFFQEQISIALDHPLEKKYVHNFLDKLQSYSWDTNNMDILGQFWEGMIAPFLKEIEFSEEKINLI